MTPEWLQQLWQRVTLWIRIPRKSRTPDHIERVVRNSSSAQGFVVHAVDVDFNSGRDKYYIRPVVSGTCKSTKACVEVLNNCRAGEVRLDTEVFVYQRDNTCNEPLFDRIHSPRRRIQPLRQTCGENDPGDARLTLYRMVVLPPQGRGSSCSPKPYRATHKNHPTAVWVRACPEHYNFAVTVGLELCREYTGGMENSQDAAASGATRTDGFTAVRRRNGYSSKRKMRHRRSSRRHTFLPLCGSRRLVSAVC